ncbi:glycerophosphodiester phosphodiesterase [Pyrofollis japonicus]|uniref:glycerophosphodiester phosphodiesterase n=1 Tax=Pyrofollis japonicus TaxID=3060460 RepID=UPI00295B865B|nr:glycerophosphodiester phosphodiesterase [Pyrofollis japonicus]BEP17743.1 glycerophosphodiester phosphodiesterase [Pyrofollis japonicus]
MNKVLAALSRKPFAVIGHRGARGRAPENTLTALRYAISVGADIAEFDVQRTRDGVLVASHDPVLRSREGVAINIRESLYEEVARVELPGGEHVPRIEEVISEARGKIALFLEVKEPSDTRPLIELVEEHGADDYVAVISFHEEAIAELKKIKPHIPGGLIYFKPPGLITQCKKIGCEIVLPRYPLATPKAVSFAHRLGLKVVAWTVNDEKLFYEMHKRSVDGIATDYPDIGVRIRDSIAQGKSIA